MLCTTCNIPATDCRFPVSHNSPSIDSITLPGEVNKVVSNPKYDCPGYGKKLSAADREALNGVDLYPFSGLSC